MKKKRLFGLTFMTLLFALVFMGCNSDDAREINDSEINDVVEGQEVWPTKLRFAETGTEGMEELQKAFGPFQETLEEVLEVEIEFFPVSNHTIATDALEFDQVDVVLAGPSEYAEIKAIIPWIETIAAIERDAYNAVIIVHEESEYQTLEDIKGSKIATKDAGSTKGLIGPSAILVEAGFDLDNDVEILLLNEARMEAFKNHEIDALAMGVNEYQSMIEEDGEGKYKVLEAGLTLPADTIIVSPNLPEDFVVEMQRRILENKEEIIESIVSSGERDQYSSAKIVKAQDSDYD